LATHELNLAGLFTQARLVGKGIVILLFLSSRWRWVLIREASWRVRRLQSAVAAAALLVRAPNGPPNLARIASATPFIGLFGTVWRS
jgi:biopolymer transport protein ExbB/TolQ